MKPVHVVVPAGIDDPARPSGGNVYDRRICQGLGDAGWTVVEYAAAGAWPRPEPSATAALARHLAGLAEGTVVLIDGLIASALPEILVPAADRLTVIVLVHRPLGDGSLPDAQPREAAVLAAAQHVVTTSAWTRDQLVARYGLVPEKLSVVEPGVDPALLAAGTELGGELLAVGAVAPHKGQDALVAALSAIADRSWRCVCIGALDLDPAYVRALREQAAAAGIADRVCFPGPRTGDDLDRAYAAADLLVHASRAETYGMVCTEALARGLPVVASAVGGLPDAIGHSGDGRRPGLLVSPGNSTALAGALRGWLTDPDLRRSLRAAAQERRSTLAGWATTVDRLAQVLRAAARSEGGGRG